MSEEIVRVRTVGERDGAWTSRKDHLLLSAWEMPDSGEFELMAKR